MTEPQANVEALPGLDLVGRGIRLRPYAPYEIKDTIFGKSDTGKIITDKVTQASYFLPDNYAINHSPAMPANAALGQVKIVESWEHLNKMLTVDTQVAGGNESFTVDASSNNTQSLRSQENSYYATRINFIPLWEVFIPNVNTLSDDYFNIELPSKYEVKHKDLYENFFRHYGTHIIKRVWVGGKAMLNLVINKSSNLSSDKIMTAINISAAGAGSAKGSSSMESSREEVRNNSSVLVQGEGGDKLKLGALRSLDDTAYNEWVATIDDNPKVIEMELAGIWTLISDPAKSKALAQAYKQLSSFRNISSTTMIDGHLFIVRGKHYDSYDVENGKIAKSGQITDLWPNLPESFDTIDGAMDWDGPTPDGRKKILFFEGPEFVAVDAETKQIDPGFPRGILDKDENGKQYIEGLPFRRVDAACNWGDGTAYLFSGPDYVRVDIASGKVEPGYPKTINPHWAGLTFERIDAVTHLDNRKVLFFRNDEYIRFDKVEYRADPGYPKTIVGCYPEDWAIS